MILVTGATGFVGRAVVRQLLAEGRKVRCLLRPPVHAYALPPGAVHVTTGNLHGMPALRAATRGVDTIIHLAGVYRREGQHTLEWVNHQGTVNLVEAAYDAGVQRIVYLSHIHADRNSAYPLLRSKGAAEEVIRGSGLDFTILRSSLIFGPEDSFTTVLAMLIKMIPLVFPVVGEGKSRFQPIHVDDMACCLTRCADEEYVRSLSKNRLENMTFDIGGPEHLSYGEILDAVLQAMHVHRVRLYARLPVMRGWVRLFERLLPNALISDEQLDLFAVDNTTDLSNVPRNFDFEPRRFTHNLGYLRTRGWRRRFLRHAFQ